MTNIEAPPLTPTTLILGGTGKTGRRLANLLRGSGRAVRTAARAGADVRFDWAGPAGHDAALDGVDRLYLVPPALRLDFADEVNTFLGRAVAAGVRHVVYLSARGVEFAPPEAAMRAVELNLQARTDLTHTALRPAFFMQNFTEGAFAGQVAGGVLTLPAGDGAEAFVDVEDIAAVAAEALSDPQRHAGAAYELTGPQALTHEEVATILTAHGHQVRYAAVPLQDWIHAATEAGLPGSYAEFLGSLLAGIAGGAGARPGPAVREVTGRDPARFEEVVAR